MRAQRDLRCPLSGPLCLCCCFCCFRCVCATFAVACAASAVFVVFVQLLLLFVLLLLLILLILLVLCCCLVLFVVCATCFCLCGSCCLCFSIVSASLCLLFLFCVLLSATFADPTLAAFDPPKCQEQFFVSRKNILYPKKSASLFQHTRILQRRNSWSNFFPPSSHPHIPFTTHPPCHFLFWVENIALPALLLLCFRQCSNGDPKLLITASSCHPLRLTSMIPLTIYQSRWHPQNHGTHSWPESFESNNGRNHTSTREKQSSGKPQTKQLSVNKHREFWDTDFHSHLAWLQCKASFQFTKQETIKTSTTTNPSKWTNRFIVAFFTAQMPIVAFLWQL